VICLSAISEINVRLACVFRKVPDSDSGKSRTVVSESPEQFVRLVIGCAGLA
jgi:hypothetical protein